MAKACLPVYVNGYVTNVSNVLNNTKFLYSYLIHNKLVYGIKR